LPILGQLGRQRIVVQRLNARPVDRLAGNDRGRLVGDLGKLSGAGDPNAA
jgi:hypothetical protein